MSEKPSLKCTYFLDVLSQWCFIADEALYTLRRMHKDLDVSLRFVPIAFKDTLPVSRDEQARAYERSAMITGTHTVPWIVEGDVTNTWEANAIPLAATDLGLDLDQVRSSIAKAALLHGLPMGREGAAISFVSKEFGIDAERLRQSIHGHAVEGQMQAHEDEFRALKLRVRPTFVIQNSIDDHVVLGGAYRFDLLDHCIRSLKSDADCYEHFETTHPSSRDS